MNSRRVEARKVAEALLEAAGIATAPVSFEPVFKWVKENLGLHVVVIPSAAYLCKNGLSGKYFRFGGQVFILVNTNEAPVRRRFTLAHELGHLMESFEVAYMSQMKPAAYDEERSADIFASEFLMPADLVREKWSKLNNTYPPTIVQYKLAKAFDVSNATMGYRLNELGLQSVRWSGTEIPPVYE